jgi:uncharacterized membrane protein
MSAPASSPVNPFRVVNGMLAVAFIAGLLTTKSSGVLDGLILILAAMASILALNRRLPLQNVLTAAGIAAVFGGIAHALTAVPNLPLPFGPLIFNPSAGAKIFNHLPWTIPLLWIVVILNARGVSRLILRPWREVKNYGFWLMGLTVLLVVAFDVALEPFAARVKHLWIWKPTGTTITWQGATSLNFIAWALVSLLILAFATPFLIRKQGNLSDPDLHPLFIWLGALLLFTIGCAETGLWLAVVADAVLALVTVCFSVRGAKWQVPRN